MTACPCCLRHLRKTTVDRMITFASKDVRSQRSRQEEQSDKTPASTTQYQENMVAKLRYLFKRPANRRCLGRNEDRVQGAFAGNGNKAGRSLCNGIHSDRWLFSRYCTKQWIKRYKAVPTSHDVLSNLLPANQLLRGARLDSLIIEHNRSGWKFWS